jgi:putative Ca2+/H+ antiporter (TMEM165/GDT1 family)
MKFTKIKILTLILISCGNIIAVRNNLRIPDTPLLLTIQYTEADNKSITIDNNVIIPFGLDLFYLSKEISEKSFISLILFYCETHPLLLLFTVFITKVSLIYLSKYVYLPSIVPHDLFEYLAMIMYYLLCITTLYKLMAGTAKTTKPKFDFDDCKVEKRNFIKEIFPIFKVLGYVVISFLIRHDNDGYHDISGLLGLKQSLMVLCFKVMSIFIVINLAMLIGFILVKNISTEVYLLISGLIFLLFAVDQTIKYYSHYMLA